MKTSKYLNNAQVGQTSSTATPAMQEVVLDIANLDQRVSDIEDGTITTDDLTVTNDASVGNDLTVTNDIESTAGSVSAATELIVVADGTVAEPALKVGTTENGFYEVSASQLGVSVKNALATIFEADGVHSDGVFPRVAQGTAGTDVVAVTNGDGRSFVTELTLDEVSLPIAGAAAAAVGALIYTFPAGAHLHEVSYMNVELQGGGTVNADTPDVGIGSVIGTGAVATLDGTPEFEDYITGQTAADCNGTATEVGPIGATAGILTGISLNAVGGVKAVHLNVADTWAGADTILASGKVVLKWTIMS